MRKIKDFLAKRLKRIKKIKGMPKERLLLISLGLFILMAVVTSIFVPYWLSAAPRGFGLDANDEVPYWMFKEAVEKGQVAPKTFIVYRTIVIVQQNVVVFDVPHKEATYWTIVPISSELGYSLYPFMESNGLKTAVKTEYPWSYIAFMGTSINAQLILFTFFIYLIFEQKRQIENLRGMGKLQSRKLGGRKVTFEDVAGIDEPKKEVQKIVQYIKNPAQYLAVRARMPRGVLLVGPPGTGKTLLARAVAFEAGISVGLISGAEFIEMFVGVGAARARDLFYEAIANAPYLIVIDELDAAAAKRTGYTFGGEREYIGLVNQLLSLFDIIEKEDILVFVIGITNRPDMLDPALVRPGRFDRHIEIPLPGQEGRKDILSVHINRPQRMPIAFEDEKTALDRIARETPGFSGADLANLVNEAALRAGDENRKYVTPEDFLSAIDRVLMGYERMITFSDEEKELLSVHESGHALARKLLPGLDPTCMVSILPRGRYLGYTRHLPSERYIITDAQILNEMQVLLAGRAAEKILLGKLGSGAADDIEKAMALARNYVCVYGMSDLGPIHIPDSNQAFWSPSRWSPELTAMAEREIKKILLAQDETVKSLLQDSRKKLGILAMELKTKKRLTGDDLDQLLK